MISLPRGVAGGPYRASIPLIRKSRLTTKERGGVGKDLSEGWCLNFAVGCTHACPFCYVDAIHKRFGSRYGPATKERWGDYLLVPENIVEAIEKTPWSRWRGKEVMMSSTHDPYLPQLAGWAHIILKELLHSGIRVCLQTRSYLVVKDIPLLTQFPDLVRLQVSIATMDEDLARKIEPRVPTPERRLEVLRMAKAAGIPTGVILAPILFVKDIAPLVEAVAAVKPDHVYGESLHRRGANMRLLREAMGGSVPLAYLDGSAAIAFRDELRTHGLEGTWWPE